MRVRGVLVAVAASVVLAAAPAAHGVRALPEAGIAIETSRGVDLVGLDGRVRSTLPGYEFRSLGVERPGQVALRDQAGRAYELRAGTFTRVAARTVTLPRGYSLSFRRAWTLARSGRVVERFPPRTMLQLDDRGLVLSAVRESGTATARDLRTGTRSALPRGCRVGAVRDGVRFELCGLSRPGAAAPTIVRVDSRGRRRLAGPATRSTQRGPTGSWRSVSLSPAGDRLLAQWSGECEIPSAHVVDARTGRMTEVAGGVEAFTLGWAGGAALVSLPRGACGASADRPGVYAIDPRGRARLIRAFAGPRARAAAWR